MTNIIFRKKGAQPGNKNARRIDGFQKTTVVRITKKVLIDNGRCLYTCERCGKKRNTPCARHHKDRDRTNNTSENIEVLCPSCHGKEHLSERTRSNYGTFAK